MTWETGKYEGMLRAHLGAIMRWHRAGKDNQWIAERINAGMAVPYFATPGMVSYAIRCVLRVAPHAANPPEATKSRALSAAKMRTEGKTFRQIGEALGVTGARASVICRRGQKLLDSQRRQLHHWPPDGTQLIPVGGRLLWERRNSAQIQDPEERPALRSVWLE